MKLKAPFPWFGAKSRIADEVWARFGDVVNYVEPMFGSGAVLLARPEPYAGIETVNDADGFIRALAADPEQVARYADWPVNECDQHARHIWLVGQRESLTARLEGDPDFYDAKIAGWWCWGICTWIGSGWCSGDGPWQSVDGQLVHLGNAGRGVHRQRVHLGDAGRGVHRKSEAESGIYAWFEALAERLRRVRVCCGDWSRVVGPTVTVRQGLTAVFLDPPYSTAERTADLYAVDGDIAGDVRRWAIEHGDDPLLRIALCDYGEAEHEMPATWERLNWKAQGGYGSQGSRGSLNAEREVVWFSPHALKPDRPIQGVLL